MKTRNDYVSNSSSCSFIINFDDNGACIDKGFMMFLKQLKSFSVSGQCKNREQFEEIQSHAVNAFGSGSDTSSDNDFYISIDVNRDELDIDNAAQTEAIKEIIALEDSSFYCYGGYDDFDIMVKTTQIATLLESRYKQISIQGDDHFEYDSIRGTELDIQETA